MSLQEGREGGPRELQAHQPHLVPWAGDGAANLGAIARHMVDEKIIRSSQHGFTKGKSCLSSLINFYSEKAGLVDEGRAVDIVYLDSSKAFVYVSHNILTDKLLMYGLDEQTVKWIENRLHGQAQGW